MRKEPKKPLPLIPDGRLAQVIEYITENLGSDLSVGDLASIARMGLSGFARSFKATVGVTPHAYLLQERIEKAKRLLAANHFSMADIALESGFGSQAHFTTVFHKMVGATPRAYRRCLGCRFADGRGN